MAIAHRSVIVECLASVGLVLTTIMHRLVWPWYWCRDQMSTQRHLAHPHHEFECGTGVSRSPVENHITAWCRRGHVGVCRLVFTGPVRWTGKKTEIELNPTAKDRTTGCGCTNSEFFWLPVATFVKKSKNRKKTGLDRLQPVFRPVMCWTLVTHIFP